MKSFNLHSDTDAREVLLMGNISRAFLDTDAVSKLPFEIHADMRDAVEAAAKKSFAAICVVMSGGPSELSSALKALREVNRYAKIILLAQMYEEPIAIKLVDSACNGENAADDYFICPVQANRFYESIMPRQDRSRNEPGASVTVDADTEMKTRRAATLIAAQRVKQLERLATTDELTGLKNRRYIWEFSRQIIEHAKKEDRWVTLLMFDIDDFKHYNDVYGHSAGDEILKQASVLVRRCCRSHDVVGRIGGDEFAVIFWDDPKRKAAGTEAERRSAMAEHPREAIFIANRFRRELSKAELDSLGLEGKGVLTISGGLASFPRDGSNIQELFQQADKALLDAKRSGKNRIYLVGEPESDIADIE